MENRREFLKNGLVFCLGTGGLLAARQACAFPDTGSAKWGLIIDIDRCIGCQSCMVACKLQNRTAPDRFNTTITAAETGDDGQAKIYFTPELCRHCSDAPCVAACATGAAFVHPSGLVMTDWQRCDGNGACIGACPYNARFADPRFSNRTDKCDLCINLLAQGLAPACVENCPTGARIPGRFDAPEGEFAQYLKQTKPSKPGTAVILHPQQRKGQPA